METRQIMLRRRIYVKLHNLISDISRDYIFRMGEDRRVAAAHCCAAAP